MKATYDSIPPGRCCQDPFPLLSCALDPHFKRLIFLPVHIKEEVKEMLINELTVAEGPEETKDAAARPDSLEPAPKRSTRESVLDRLLCQPERKNWAPKRDDILAEDAPFMAGSSLHISHNPFDRWKINEDCFACLAASAKKYLACPASSTSAERVYSTGGCLVTKLSAALTPVC